MNRHQKGDAGDVDIEDAEKFIDDIWATEEGSYYGVMEFEPPDFEKKLSESFLN